MEKIYRVRTEREQITLFCRFAEKYKSDFATIDVLKRFSQNVTRSFPDVPKWAFESVRDLYTLEEGEQILRPKIFATIGGDCDDQFIFWLALFLDAGFTKSDLLVCESREPDSADFTHIFLGVEFDGERIYFDSLPEYTVEDIHYLQYDEDLVRITPVSDYI